MRSKALSIYTPLLLKLKLVYKRITFSRITILYFFIAAAHCAIQIIFQVEAFTINNDASHLLGHIVDLANVTQEFAILDRDLTLCNGLPSSSNCQVVWKPQPLPTTVVATSGGSASPPSDASGPEVTITHTVFVAPTATAVSSAATNARRRLSITKRDVSLAPVFDSQNDFQGINVTGLIGSGAGSNGDGSFLISTTCIQALEWPIQVLANTKREDATFIAFQLWVLGMSIVALLNESIPHSIATLLTHGLATGWSFFQLAHTADFQRQFTQLTTSGACRPNNLLPTYWKRRRDAEIPSAVFNATTLVLISLLTYRLMKLFGWQTFKRVGASLTINRVYRLVLAFSIAIQLSLFFVIAFMSLWLDQLVNGMVAKFSQMRLFYVVLDIVIICLIVPWLSLGWYAVRREHRWKMAMFLILAVVQTGGWGALFVSDTFRWTFVAWRFFSVLGVAAAALTIFTFVLGVICRLNFGKGLTRYLQVDDSASDYSENFKSTKGLDNFEKVDFPSPDQKLPSFSAMFGSGADVPPPRQMRFGPVPHQGGRLVRPPPAALIAARAAQQQQRDLSRTPSNSSSSSSRSGRKFDMPQPGNPQPTGLLRSYTNSTTSGGAVTGGLVTESTVYGVGANNPVYRESAASFYSTASDESPRGKGLKPSNSQRTKRWMLD